MNVLYWDVETTDLELAVRTYQLKNYTKYHNWKDIKRDWTMLGAAWQFEGDKRPQAISVSPQNPLDDEYVIKYVHEVLSGADVLIGHNSDNFDLKKFNTRAAFYGLPPLSQKVQIDTLKIARKYFKFTSNSLGYICHFLGLAEKDESPNWKKVIDGCPDALREMREYNKQDIVTLKALYEYLAPYHHTHPNISKEVRDINGDEVLVCKRCSSPKVVRRGARILASGRKRQQYSCNNCGGWQTGKLM